MLRNEHFLMAETEQYEKDMRLHGKISSKTRLFFSKYAIIVKDIRCRFKFGM